MNTWWLAWWRRWFARQSEAEHLRRGRLGEDAARDPLRALGWHFLTANYRTARGEIDLVFRDDATLDVVAVNKLDEGVRCTPAMAGNRIHVRGADHLRAVGE